MPDTTHNESSTNPESVRKKALSAEIQAVETRNLFALSAHYISLRLGWIFKTETVIMPAFMDAISGAGWLRGCLPVVNRICSSLPPLFFAPRLKDSPRKKLTLSAASFLMAVPFCVLAIAWRQAWQPESSLVPGWFPALFLLCYGVVFVGAGLQRLAWGLAGDSDCECFRINHLADGVIRF